MVFDHAYDLRPVMDGWAVDSKKLTIVKVTCYEYDDYKNGTKLIWYKSSGVELDPSRCKLFSSEETAREYAIRHWNGEVKRYLNAIEDLTKPKSKTDGKTP